MEVPYNTQSTPATPRRCDQRRRRPTPTRGAHPRAFGDLAERVAFLQLLRKGVSFMVNRQSALAFGGWLHMIRRQASQAEGVQHMSRALSYFVNLPSSSVILQLSSSSIVMDSSFFSVELRSCFPISSRKRSEKAVPA